MKSLTLIAILTLIAASSPWAAADSPITPTIIAPPLTSSVPPLINYQGTLTDDNGVPIPDGPRKLEFNLYDHPLAGNKVWGPQVFDDVPVVNGRFNIILGPVDNNSSQRSLTAAFGGSDRYLGFKVGAGGADLSAIAEIAPRQAILAAPYAINALHGVPIGSIMAYFGSTAPEGWLLCDGRLLTDSSLQDAKFDILKTHLNGLGMSSIPDLRGRVVVGPDSMGQGAANRITLTSGRTLGGSGGEEYHTLTVDQMPSHLHGYGDIFFSEKGGTVPVFNNFGTAAYTDADNAGYEIARNTNPTGGGKKHNNMPPYLVVTYIIKY